jgi:hypothetical protein
MMITRGIFLAGLILGLLATPSLIAQDKKRRKKGGKERRETEANFGF